MRIVIDINDDMIKRWGAIYIHNPQYDAKKVAVFLPGFDYAEQKEGSYAIKVNVLSSPVVSATNKKQDEKGDGKKDNTPAPLSVATPNNEKADDKKDTKPEKDVEQEKKPEPEKNAEPEEDKGNVSEEPDNKDKK